MTNNCAISGLSWGDEAKGAWTHRFSTNFDYVIRTSGSSNCGHRIVRDGIVSVHHLIPSVDWRNPKPQAFLGCGMVINPEELLSEIKTICIDYKDASSRIMVDPYAFITDQSHIEEDKAKNKHIGTTNKGVGPAYLSKYSRSGKRIIDVMDSPAIKELQSIGVRFLSAYEMNSQFKISNCIFEGAQGVLLDLNFGTYPYVTSTDVTISSIGSSGFNSLKLNKSYGVTKAYVTRVGEGPFPTEIFGDEAKYLQIKGNEVGSTTGRSRRVGWLDLPALHYACEMGGITEFIVTKLDILAGMKEIPVCISYDKPITGPKSFFDAKPDLELVRGWDDPKDINQPNLRNYLKIIEEYTQRPVTYVSVGVNSEDMIKL